ncbi:MAG: NAD(P)/FAD-dependent oxidoreductase [Leeuwenhoekiella sp.]
MNKQIIVIGGGLAGLTAAIHLSRAGKEVLLIERHSYPKHKVCGEYVSNEVLPYLKELGIDPFEAGAVSIDTLQFSSGSGKMLTTKLPLGGFGLSRFTLDKLLFEKAVESGCKVMEDTVTKVRFKNDKFSVETQSGEKFESEIVIGSFGKRSNLDKSLSRKFITKKTPWIGVKSHYAAQHPDHIVGLHNFKGGYCGISKVENNRINVCYLAHLDSFGKYKDVDAFKDKVMQTNPHLRNFFTNAEPLFEKALTISQISFDQKNRVEDHVLMAGDSAALIHPLCGNGMAMAIMGAKLLSENILNYFRNSEISHWQMEKNYSKEWEQHFKERLFYGRQLQRLLEHPELSDWGIRLAQYVPALIQKLITKTHGRPQL